MHRGLGEVSELMGDDGPAMRELTVRQRAFVLAYFEARSGAAAARAAGYSEGASRRNLKTMAYELLRNAKVKAAILEVARGRYVGLLPKAMSVQEEIMNDPKHRDRFKAAQHIAAAAGIAQVVEHRHEHVLSVSEQFAELIRLGRKPEEILMNLPEAEKQVVLDLVKGKDGGYS